MLVFLQLFRILDYRFIVVSAVFFSLWSGLDFIGQLIIQRHWVGYFQPIEIYYLFSYTSFTTDLYNVFNQVIATWLITLWVFRHRHYIPVFPLTILLAYAPFPFLGLSLFYGFYVIIDLVRSTKQTTLLQAATQLWTRVDLVSALAGLLAIAVPYLTFYKAHIPNLLNQFFLKRLMGPPLSVKIELIMNYGITIFLEAGIYFGLIWLLSPATYERYKRVYWISFFMLSLMPLWEAGQWMDFATRGTIPCLTILAVLTLKAIQEAYQQRQAKWAALSMTALTLIISWITPLWLITKTPAFTNPPVLRNNIESFGDPKVRADNDREGLMSSLPNFYSIDPQDHFFYQIMAKRPPVN